MAYISQTLRGTANPEGTHPSNNVGSINGIAYQVESNPQNSADDRLQWLYESCTNQKGIRRSTHWTCSAVKDCSPKPCERCTHKGLLCEYLPVALTGRRPQPPPVSTVAPPTPRPSDQNYEQFRLAPLAPSEHKPYRPWHRRPDFNTANSERGYSHLVAPTGSRSSESHFGFPAGEPNDMYLEPTTHDPSAGFLGPQSPNQSYAMYDQFEFAIVQPNIDSGLGIFVPAACRYYNPVG
ncbi:hypothetical protein C8R44DRAFT_734735 [Mycena epipterygia]|nr:hypothetical protein C8R44DRAFT_734735 [Mycena epipterygia]